MKLHIEPGRRSQLSRGGRIFASLVFFLIAAGALFVRMDPSWLRWVFVLVSLVGLGTLVIWRSHEQEELEEEDLIEIARQAIHTEAERLDNKRADLERILMSYGEWMEFPDFEKLQQTEWQGEVPGADQRVTEILDEQADKLLSGFSSGEFWEDGKFQTRKLLIELFNFMEQIAQVYYPEADRPILETNLESLLKAVNRASLQVILLLEELPLLDIKEMNIRKASDSVRKASKVYRKYEELQPFLEPVRYLWQGSKFLLTSNPLIAAGWIAGTEILWKGGKRIGKKAMDAYLLSLVRQTLGILAWETAGIYDKSYRYRSPDWVYGMELVHMASEFEPTTDLTRAVFKELGSLPFRSSYDRIFLYRCLANHVSPKPERFEASTWLSDELSGEICDKLGDFTVKNLEETESKAYHKWNREMRNRLLPQTEVDKA